MESAELDKSLQEALSERQRQALEQYLDALLSANQRINLTALRDRQGAWNRHILESLRVAAVVPDARNLIDVGTGGGLPGMVLAIARPETEVTLLEATEKKARFLEDTARALGLENVTVVCDRAERASAAGARLRESFDVVTARAVAALPTLLELTLPFVKPGGTLLAIKGQKAADELEASKNALSILQARESQSIRHPSATLLLIEKTGTCPTKYPRRSGEPKRHPL